MCGDGCLPRCAGDMHREREMHTCVQDLVCGTKPGRIFFGSTVKMDFQDSAGLSTCLFLVLHMAPSLQPGPQENDRACFWSVLFGPRGGQKTEMRTEKHLRDSQRS